MPSIDHQHAPLNEADISTNEASREFLAGIKTDPDGRLQGKIVLISDGQRLLVGLGALNTLHVLIVQTFEKSHGARFVSDNQLGKETPRDGVTIQGASFTADWDSGFVAINGYSTQFGGFEDGLFQRETARVIRDFIMGQINAMKTEGISTRPAAAELDTALFKEQD